MGRFSGHHALQTGDLSIGMKSLIIQPDPSTFAPDFAVIGTGKAGA
jgi:hypothetical protein